MNVGFNAALHLIGQTKPLNPPLQQAAHVWLLQKSAERWENKLIKASRILWKYEGSVYCVFPKRGQRLVRPQDG